MDSDTLDETAREPRVDNDDTEVTRVYLAVTQRDDDEIDEDTRTRVFAAQFDPDATAEF